MGKKDNYYSSVEQIEAENTFIGSRLGVYSLYQSLCARNCAKFKAKALSKPKRQRLFGSWVISFFNLFSHYLPIAVVVRGQKTRKPILVIFGKYNRQQSVRFQYAHNDRNASRNVRCVEFDWLGSKEGSSKLTRRMHIAPTVLQESITSCCLNRVYAPDFPSVVPCIGDALGKA